MATAMNRIPSLRASDRLEEEEPTPSWHNLPKRQLRCIKDSGDLAVPISLHFDLDLESPCHYRSRNRLVAGHQSHTAVHACLA